MKFERQHIPDLVVIHPAVVGDERGFFMETRHERKFAEAGIDARFVQENHSSSKRGVLRGLHYQIEQVQGKLVRVVEGEVFDVAVDLRRGSPSFGKWAGVRLSAENKSIFWIPPGFAHGFYVMSDVAQLVYSCTDFYAPAHERYVLWNDADLAIRWPLDPSVPTIVSEKDKAGRRLADAECYS